MMTGRIFLHIGMHKTGSTAIQSAFAGYDNGVLSYAPLTDKNHSIPFYTADSGNHTSYHIWQRENLSDKEIEAKKNYYLREIRELLTSMKNRNILFSGEDLSVIDKPGVENIAFEFQQSGMSVTVIVYVRSPHSFALSDFQEQIKSGYVNPVLQPPNYRYRIEKFIETFGRENVLIRDFDAIREANGDVVDDISYLMNISAPTSRGNYNVGMSTDAAKVVLKINKIVGANEKQGWARMCRWRCIKHACSLIPGKFDIPSNLIAAYNDSNDTEWLRAASGIDYSSNITGAPEQGSGNLEEYLNEVSSPAKQVILEALAARDGVIISPYDTDTLISRYLLSFALPVEGEFDPNRYLENNLDVKESGVNPYVHYVENGLREGRDF